MKPFDVEKLVWGCAQDVVTGVVQQVPGLVVRALTAHDDVLEAQQRDKDRALKAQTVGWIWAQYENTQDPQVRVALLKALGDVR